MAKYVLALDQGTTSSRAIVFDRGGTMVGVAQEEFEQILPSPGHVEHDPEAIWDSQLRTMRGALEQAGATFEDIAAVGVTNQRETTVLWERETGRPVGNAIVWQSRISAPICDRLKEDGVEPLFREKTGLVIDAYFSGTKIKYMLDNHEGLRERAKKGEICFGTIDSWLIWKLTKGKCHVTDPSNASRTLLFNIRTLDWDEELLRILDIPRAMLPEVKPSSGVIADIDAEWIGGSVPLAGIAGDQQAAAFGQACFEPGSVKNTYGTGCFVLMNVGDRPVPSKTGLLTTVGWEIGGETTYFLEGAIFVAGAVVQWLRDKLGIIQSSAEVETLAAQVEDSGGVYFVPAFVGLGAPDWDAYARGTIIGLDRSTTAAHIARAALESMAYQTRDIVEAEETDAGMDLSMLKVDGGASKNNLLMQFQADLLGATLRRPKVAETTALGAAYLAGLAVGYWNDFGDITANWALDQEFTPQVSREEALALYDRWREAVKRSRGWVI